MRLSPNWLFVVGWFAAVLALVFMGYIVVMF